MEGRGEERGGEGGEGMGGKERNGKERGGMGEECKELSAEFMAHCYGNSTDPAFNKWPQ